MNISSINRQGIWILLLLAIVLVATFAAFRPGLTGPLVLDDQPQLGGLIAESARAPSVLVNNYLVSTSGPLGRPVSMLTFIADAIAYGPDIEGWKYSSLMFHLVCGLLLFWLTAALVRASRESIGLEPWMAGLIVAACWLVHPLNVSTVLYTVQRMSVLSTLFVFAGLIAYVKGRLLLIDGKNAGWIPVALTFIVFLPLAALSKENGLLLLVYCTLLELVVFRFAGPIKSRNLLWLVHGGLAAGYLAACVLVLANFEFVSDGYLQRDFTLLERVLTQFRVLALYLSQLLVPLPGKMGFFHDDFTVSTGLFSPGTTILSIGLIVALIGGALALRRKHSLLAFGVLFFFASHILESTFFGLELVFEHRNYTGSAGIILALVVALSSSTLNRRVLAGGAVLTFGLLCALTWQRAVIWSAPQSLIEHAYRVHPESPRVNLLLANVYAAAEYYPDARSALAKVGEGWGSELHVLYLDCLEYGRVERADLEKLAHRKSDVIDAHVTSTVKLLVQASLAGRCQVEQTALLAAIDNLLNGHARSAEDRAALYFAKADLLQGMRRVDEAVEIYMQAQALTDTHAVPTYLAADAYAKAGRPDEARAMLERAAEAEKTSRVKRKDLAELIYAGIGELYASRGQVDEALATYDEAISTMPHSMQFYVTAAELLLRQERYNEAAGWLTRMRKIEQAGSSAYDYRIERIASALAIAGRPATVPSP